MAEEDVRHEIVSLLRCKKSIFHTFDSLTKDDFEYKRIRVPDGNVDGIKILYRSGAVYMFVSLDHFR